MILSLLLALPFLLLIVYLFIPQSATGFFKWSTLAITLVQLVISLFVFLNFRQPETVGLVAIEGFQYVEKVDWISLNLGSLGKLSIDYFLGVDGLSISMVLLTSVVMVIGALSSWNISKNVKGYFALFAVLNSTIIGCFVALDFFLFYLFFEFMLLPMYFLIGVWGGPRKEYAAIKFFLFTLLGSIFILIVMIGLYNSVIDPIATAINLGLKDPSGHVLTIHVKEVQQLLSANAIPTEKLVRTFSLLHMSNEANFIPGSVFHHSSVATVLGYAPRSLAFLALFIGFAIKLPLVPLHTWLPDAHVEAPTPISVILAGILLKVGGYGLLRTGYVIFPDEAMSYAWFAGLLGVVSIVYGAYNALAQQDLKKLIAYSSVSHMGFVMLGIASGTVEGTTGAIYQLFSHGIISAMLFLLVGVIYDRTGDRQIGSYAGLIHKMPVYTSLTMVAFFASLGLPGFSGFIAELFVFLGSFASAGVNGLLPRWMPLVSLIGIIIGAGYYLWTLQRMFFGEFSLKKEEWSEKIHDLTFREYLMFVPLAVMTLLLGIFPNWIIDSIQVSVNQFVALMR